MQIVIDIPKYVYDLAKEDFYIYDCDITTVANAIANSVLLPENHGRLIDADLLREQISTRDTQAYTKHRVWLLASIYNTEIPTILEARRQDK